MVVLCVVGGCAVVLAATVGFLLACRELREASSDYREGWNDPDLRIQIVVACNLRRAYVALLLYPIGGIVGVLAILLAEAHVRVLSIIGPLALIALGALIVVDASTLKARRRIREAASPGERMAPVTPLPGKLDDLP